MNHALSTGESYTYDANGNMDTREEGGVTYTQNYDAENRLISVNVTGQSLPTLFIYDGDGNLVKQVKPDGSRTLYVGGVYEVNKDASGAQTGTKTYYPVAGAMMNGMKLYFVLKDHLGSANVVMDGYGNTVPGADTRYYPFGEARVDTSSMITDKLYTGQRQIAELGIYHYGARFYSPKLGRFLSADTIVPGYANPQNLNRFSYVTNNPLRYTDPTGHMVSEGNDGGLGVKGYKYVIKKKFKWHLKGEWSQEEVKTIYQTGNDILAHADGVTGGNGLDWMHGALGNTTIIHGGNKGEHSETWPTLFGPKIWLGRGWLNDGGWDSKELLAHELGHVWDISSGFSASGEMNKDLGGSSWCFFCAPGDDVPQWNPDVHYS